MFKSQCIESLLNVFNASMIKFEIFGQKGRLNFPFQNVYNFFIQKQ